MSVTHNEVVKLLALVAAIDDITVTETKIAAWRAMAEQGGWESFEAARRALLVYRSENPNFPVKPGHITQVLERVRKAASAEFNRRELDPPREALADPTAYRTWILARSTEHHAAVMAKFVAGDRPALRAIEAAS